MSGSKSETFVNEGLLRWEEMRAAWRGGTQRNPRPDVRAKNVDVDEVIQRVYSTSGGGKLPEPLPLSQMIDILIDFWEADGLFD
mmetsp:Transcript_352/g.645  ORF Transcript_352/g.645 Transcript_352/m.645 type:complete len:84 (+) Transcript_352:56-307(+)|eukprot:CAMPEP_0185017430 /NCGR_PEP_ID=MMETSP1103-20130426/390_1 /TAXON_ID=36769 /ORGANISM="Paraphysomonas bandaiensis, Strain Caron Lab Isolate" /LENGTH=83 /DNA_ID=CAMNT_0027546847 /DNA_START=55 /DNA_END=306 /DNA_ORIENTATION=+